MSDISRRHLLAGTGALAAAAAVPAAAQAPEAKSLAGKSFLITGTSSGFGKLGALLMRPLLRRMFMKLDYAEYGGAPLLGVDGAVIIAHGSSSPKAIKNAIFVAARYARERINQHIQTELQGLSLGEVSG